MIEPSSPTLTVTSGSASAAGPASGAPLPPAVGGRLHAMSGPPYAVLLSDCNCQAAANVHTATVAPETHRSTPAEVRRGSIFGRPC